ncbi:MAG: replication-associated recombination protein A [Chitinophagaceae bacterium]|nr:MAG: replication-associated recombination protein A [Chitinophagaceae bacterium]
MTNSGKQIPLAERLRPDTIDMFRGQQHLVGKGKVIRNMIEAGKIQSMILWGPPGSGKTTLASLLANHLSMPFYKLSAIRSGVKEVREIIDKAKDGSIILFLDEIHRFNKSQQDALLGSVENGSLILIGATTENPSFEVNSALLSRCQVYTLQALDESVLTEILNHAIQNDEVLKNKNIEVQETAALFQLSGGDARKLLNLLEIIVEHSREKVVITNEQTQKIAQQNMLRYDKDGEQHYDIISAFIKSMRGSDPNASVYWLARMIAGGEDPKFIARRMLIFSSEDIGNANPTAMILANNCFQAVQVIGYPECRLVLSQTAIYLALSPKSNASYMAINAAEKLVHNTGNLSVPLHLRNAPTKLMKDLNYSKGYKYPHDFKDNFVFEEYLPEELKGKTFYNPQNNAKENSFRNWLKKLWNKKYNY